MVITQKVLLCLLPVAFAEDVDSVVEGISLFRIVTPTSAPSIFVFVDVVVVVVVVEPSLVIIDVKLWFTARIEEPEVVPTSKELVKKRIYARQSMPTQNNRFSIKIATIRRTSW